jgi:HAD superfamily phosphatase (TIGR01668 family)
MRVIKQWLGRRYRPDGNADSILDIDFDAVSAAGYRLVLLDIDNTLVMHGKDQPDATAMEAVRRVRMAGMDCIVVSNARSSRSRVFCDRLGVDCISYAGKPSPRGVLEACRRKDVPAGFAVLIGDQLFTDVAAARRSGCASILVRPRSRTEPFLLKLKRLLEQPLVRCFRLDRLYMALPSPHTGTN